MPLSLCMLAYHLNTLSKPVSPDYVYPCKRPAKVLQKLFQTMLFLKKNQISSVISCQNGDS